MRANRPISLRAAITALCQRHRDRWRLDSSAVTYLVSAKGAVFNHSPPQDGFAVANLGQSPKEIVNEKPLALKARFIRALSRAFSARSLGNTKSRGAAPGYRESAPSALNTSVLIQPSQPLRRSRLGHCYSSYRTASNSKPAAFSLVEIVLALGIEAFCLIAISGLMPVGMQINRNATSQTAATNITAGVVADLRATPAAATTSPQFAITFGTDKTLYFDASGQASTSLSPDSRYQLNIRWNSAPTGFYYADLKVTWPASVEPATAGPGSIVAIFAAFDRN